MKRRGAWMNEIGRNDSKSGFKVTEFLKIFKSSNFEIELLSSSGLTAAMALNSSGDELRHEAWNAADIGLELSSPEFD